MLFINCYIWGFVIDIILCIFIYKNVIGVIDSGLGGLNVIAECLKLYNEDFIYLIDNKNCPYGNKKVEDIKEIIISNINSLINMYDLDFIILACNTASAILNADDLLKFNIPILKTFPNVKDLCKSKNGLLFATKNTIENSKLVKYYKLNYPKIKFMHIKNLAKEIDENINKNNEKIQKILKKEIINKNKLKNKYAKVSCIALGCTHFKYIKNILNNLFNNKIIILECEKEVALNSKYLIKGNKNNLSVKVVLTKQDDEFKYVVEKFVDNLIYHT